MKHKKKRNIGLLYEFLIRHISNSLIEENDKNVKKAVKIFKKFFKKDTELYKEFRLFNALFKSAVKSESVASSILSEAKKHSSSFDLNSLNREKSLLIREINHNLNDQNFFLRRIPEYRIHATIQNLINCWQNENSTSKNNFPDIQKKAELEQIMTEWLLTEKEGKYNLDEHFVSDIDGLVVKLMNEKVNNKYSKVLNEEQKNIIKSYAFSFDGEDKNELKNQLLSLKENVLNNIDEYLSDEENKNSYIEEKLLKAKSSLLAENFEDINDELVSMCLKFSQLKEELLNKD